MEEPLDFELDPVTRITVGAIGEPGFRKFYLQARNDENVVSLKCEKEHAFALATHVDRLLAYLTSELGDDQDSYHDTITEGMDLDEPVLEAWAVGELSATYDAERDLVLLAARQLGDDDEDLSEARFWATREQMRALAAQAARIAAGGRPNCPFCTMPIDADGHDCPARNGQKRSELDL